MNENEHDRGLHLVIVNPSSFEVEHARIFDTYESSEQFYEFITHNVPEGYIVIVACKDDCVKNLTLESKMWFDAMGSVEIWNLGYRQGYVFVGKNGIKLANEKRSSQNLYHVSVTQIMMQNG